MNQTSQSDALIDHVLTGLRDTVPPDGLETRIAHRIQEAAEAHTPPLFVFILNVVKDPRILLAAAPRYTLAGTATAGAAIAVLLAASLIASNLHRSLPAHPVSTASTAHPAPAPQTIAAQKSRPLPVASFKPPAQRNPSRLPTPLCDCDPIALAESNAPSHPAPQMPLTQQERLMLSVLRSGNQEEIAALNPTERDASLARDRADFQHFFAPSFPVAKTGDKE